MAMANEPPTLMVCLLNLPHLKENIFIHKSIRINYFGNSSRKNALFI